MNNIEQLSIKGRSVLHRPVSSDIKKPACMILLHGYGADEYDLMGLAQFFPSELQILSIRGGGTTPMGGASWFDIDMLSDGSLRFNIEQAKVSTRQVIEIIDTMQQDGIIQSDQIILAGFSQGATISNLVTIQKKENIRALLIMSGRLPENIHEMVGDPVAFQNLPVFAGHGTQDTVIPIQYGRDIVSFWDPIAKLEHHEYPMGHEISQAELDQILAWVQTVLSDPKS